MTTNFYYNKNAVFAYRETFDDVLAAYKAMEDFIDRTGGSVTIHEHGLPSCDWDSEKLFNIRDGFEEEEEEEIEEEEEEEENHLIPDRYNWFDEEEYI